MSAWLVSRWLVRSYCLILACGFCGCATTKVDWNSRVGKVTYDEIVVDMGPPDKQAKLQDGTCVAEWLTRRSSHVAYVGGFYGPGCYYYPPYYPAYTDYYSPDYYLRLVFDPEGRLQSWKQFRR